MRKPITGTVYLSLVIKKRFSLELLHISVHVMISLSEGRYLKSVNDGVTQFGWKSTPLQFEKIKCRNL